MERMTRTNSLAFTQISVGLSYTGTREKYCLHHEKSCDVYGRVATGAAPVSATYRLERSGDGKAPAMLTVTADSGILHMFLTQLLHLNLIPRDDITERASSYWLNGLKPEMHVNDIQISVFTSQETNWSHISRTSYLMLFRNTPTHCSENQQNTLVAIGEQSARFQNVQAGSIYNNHWVLKGHCDCYFCFPRFPEISQQTQRFYVFNLKIF
jgi:hypothetical protein